MKPLYWKSRLPWPRTCALLVLSRAPSMTAWTHTCLHITIIRISPNSRCSIEGNALGLPRLCTYFRVRKLCRAYARNGLEESPLLSRSAGVDASLMLLPVTKLSLKNQESEPNARGILTARPRSNQLTSIERVHCHLRWLGSYPNGDHIEQKFCLANLTFICVQYRESIRQRERVLVNNSAY